MRILITGGTGFLGKRLAKEAQRRGAQVAVLSHNVDDEERKRGNLGARLSDDEFRQLGIKVIEGDILNREQLKNAFAGYDVVYHLAAELDESSPDLWQVNVEGTRNVVNACKASGVKRLIFASAIGVLGESGTPLDENAPYAPETKYEKSKAAAEKLVVSSDVSYTIARMPPILGPNKIWRQIFRAAQKNYPIIGSGNNHWPLVYVGDVI
ncbi:L-arabinose 1-dehydrogenase (NAD(P)(+)) [uncultured archaeon]|nr:L-arabinose 1-dehydrogenase (NAD(P)(+)) [uncultured archaeon]